MCVCVCVCVCVCECVCVSEYMAYRFSRETMVVSFRVSSSLAVLKRQEMFLRRAEF